MPWDFLLDKRNAMKKPNPSSPKKNETKPEEDLVGYPHYPKDDDIYTRLKEEQDIDPEDPTKLKEEEPDPIIDPEEDLELEDEIRDSDLDIPGADLDDADEEIGNEDEENNFYSIGGDKHHDLEEDQGEVFPW